MTSSAILLFLLISISNGSLRVMTFNMFHFGKHVENGLRKVADQIKYVNPDVVALQEAGDEDNLDALCGLLGEEWSGDQQNRGEKSGRGVITRHKIVGYYNGYSRGYNLRIQLRGTEQEISVWSVYLHWNLYGPDDAKRGATVEHIMSLEYHTHDFKGRVHNIRELIGNEEFVKQINNADITPVIVAGDFNTPSHLDWTNATKHNHFEYVIEWPTTKLLTEQANMTDSFREVHPDPLAVPGISWSPYDTHSHDFQVKDRIDFIFYRGPLRPTRSFPFSGTVPVLYPRKDSSTDKNRTNEVTVTSTIATTTTAEGSPAVAQSLKSNDFERKIDAKSIITASKSNIGRTLTIGTLALLMLRRH